MTQKVAPHAGAWIETLYASPAPLHYKVAPHAGAWIETLYASPAPLHYKVAPHAGAWIETFLHLPHFISTWSPPTRGRGLKLLGAGSSVPYRGRPPRGGVD